jgi:hypothetical protein
MGLADRTTGSQILFIRCEIVEHFSVWIDRDEANLIRKNFDAQKLVCPRGKLGAPVGARERQVTSASTGNQLHHPIHRLHPRIKMIVPAKDKLHVLSCRLFSMACRSSSAGECCPRTV